MVVQLPYTWGYVDSINRIQRSKLKVVVVVEVGGNQKAISGGMGRVFPKNNHQKNCMAVQFFTGT